MTHPPASPPPERGGLSGYLSQILAYIDKPWKVAAVVVLVLVGGAGWIAYEKRDEIVEAWLTPSAPSLKTDQVPEGLDKLIAETDADLIQLWATDLSTNSQWFIAARAKGGERPVIPSPRRLPIIVHTSDVRTLVEVLEGRAACTDLAADGSPLQRRLFDRGMKRACAVPVPPTREPVVGLIYLAWSTKRDESNEYVAVGAAREVSRRLSK
jgi:hypothetical protein